MLTSSKPEPNVSQAIVILQNLKLKLDVSRIAARLRFTIANPITEARIMELAEVVLLCAEPKIIYRLSQATAKTRNCLKIDKVEFITPSSGLILTAPALYFLFA